MVPTQPALLIPYAIPEEDQDSYTSRNMSSTYEERTLELQIVSAVDVKKVKNLGAQHCYVVAYIYQNQQKQSQPDRTGGQNPVWNTKLKLECEEELLYSPDAFLTVEIKCHGTLRNKVVGKVTVPLRELLSKQENPKGGSTDGQVMAYDVYRPSGKVQGTLNMAVKLGEKRTVQRYRSQQTPLGYPPGAHAGTSYRPPFAPQQQSPYFRQQQVPQYYNQGGGYPPMGGYGGTGGYGGGMGGYGGGMGGYSQPRPRRGGGGMGFGTGLMGGMLGGLLVGDMLDDHGDYGGYGDDYGGSDMGDVGDMG
ncbi:hypothetical protein R1sor_018074 [Riccia sorocarpa]|uniref:C2 domain-containing protein n=1 Tax=Riccia sorocarpa TaxID=122646 RepID=A0ABD3I8T7_9MARC